MTKLGKPSGNDFHVMSTLFKLEEYFFKPRNKLQGEKWKTKLNDFFFQGIKLHRGHNNIFALFCIHLEQVAIDILFLIRIIVSKF